MRRHGALAARRMVKNGEAQPGCHPAACSLDRPVRPQLRCGCLRPGTSGSKTLTTWQPCFSTSAATRLWFSARRSSEAVVMRPNVGTDRSIAV